MNGTEDRLRAALRREAAHADGLGTGFERVRARAVGIRRRRRLTAAGLVAAAVVAVTVPTTLLLRDDNGSAPAPTHQPTGRPTGRPTHQPTTANPTPQVVHDLASVPRGAATFLGYVEGGGVVHRDGSTTQLPGTADVSTQFLPYRDGWLVGGGVDNRLREYDATGAVVASGRYGGMAVTADRTRAAWLSDDTLFQGGLSQMGEGAAASTPVPASSELIGFLPDGPVITSGDTSVQIVDGGAPRTVQVGMTPTTTSQSADLVGGLTGTVARGDLQGAVTDLRTHTRLWQSDWRPLRFSDDGSLVAAAPAAENGDTSTLAILEARTGEVLAKTPALRGIWLTRDVGWDGHRLVIPAVGGHGSQAALLALDTSDGLTRVSDVVRSAEPGGAYLILEAQP
jgi:hypothetical protein